MEVKKEKNYLLLVLLILFIIFMILYISKETGYYEYKAHNKTILTESAIKKFESDVESGRNVNVEDYIVTDKKNYSNSVSDLGYSTSNLIESFMNDGIKGTLKIVSSLFFN